MILYPPTCPLTIILILIVKQDISLLTPKAIRVGSEGAKKIPILFYLSLSRRALMRPAVEPPNLAEHPPLSLVGQPLGA
jgi:hypothetical protein